MPTSDLVLGPARGRKPLRVGENDRVRLVADLRDQGRIYRAGSTGTVVHVYQGGAAYEVELTHPAHGVVTAEANAIERLP